MSEPKPWPERSPDALDGEYISHLNGFGFSQPDRRTDLTFEVVNHDSQNLLLHRGATTIRVRVGCGEWFYGVERVINDAIKLAERNGIKLAERVAV